MQLVVRTEEGVLELAYTWLPTWIGINTKFKSDMFDALKDKIVGLTMDEYGIEQAHQLVLDYICEKNPGIQGLRDYLDALKYVYVE